MSDYKSENFRAVSRLAIESEQDFESPLTLRLYQWWASFSPNTPSRSDFKIDENWDIAQSIYLVEFLGEGKFHYRINGETVVSLVGKNQAGMTFDIHDSLPELTDLAKYYVGIGNLKKPVKCRGTLAHVDREFIEFESVDCPLVNAEGEVTHILGVLDAIPSADKGI